MPLHPIIANALEAARDVPAFETLPVDKARRMLRKAYPPRVPPVPVGSVNNQTIPGPAGPIPVRIYTPDGTGPFPLVVFFHGSGFVVLDLDTHDDICRRLCRDGRAVVVSVDYRLAPEHKFPAGPDDCHAATRWAAANASRLGADASRMVVAGDSAGGCLAIVTALRLRDEQGPPLAGQLLIYPVTNHYRRATQSWADYGAGFGLTTGGMRWFWDQYLTHAHEADDWHAAPLQAPSFAGLPPACILTAEFDVLRDEGEQYAAHLSNAGIVTALRRCHALNHGFIKWVDEIAEVAEAIEFATAWLRGITGSGPLRAAAT